MTETWRTWSANQPDMTPKQQGILDHLAFVPDRMAYRVGCSLGKQNNIGRWTVSKPGPGPRAWFDAQDIAELRRLGRLVPWHNHEDALVLASH